MVTLALLVCVGSPSQAQDFSSGGIAKAYPFKDLPGVRDEMLNPPAPPPSQAASDAEPSQNCTRDTELFGLHPGRPFGRGAPTVVYKCEQNGLVIESEHEPLPKSFNPLTLR